MANRLDGGPKLGLALGGGVARGWAHIGVLRALDEAGIVPDVMCGTSIGAVVGGCWLAGKLDALEAWARSLTRMRIVGYLDFKVGAPGLLGGERLHRLLVENLGDVTIESLPRPFAGVCTDLVTGHEIWLSSGSLVDAMRASYAMPGVFPPLAVGARQLADGALVNPVPVSVCHALGAHMVVAVNLNADILAKGRQPRSDFQVGAGFDLLEILSRGNGGSGQPGWAGAVRRVFKREETTPTLFGVMVSSLGIVLDRITRSRLAGEPPDVHIIPKLGSIGLAEFHRAAEMIDLGHAATRAALPDILEACEVFGIAVGPQTRRAAAEEAAEEAVGEAARAAAHGAHASIPDATPEAADASERPKDGVGGQRGAKS